MKKFLIPLSAFAGGALVSAVVVYSVFVLSNAHKQQLLLMEGSRYFKEGEYYKAGHLISMAIGIRQQSGAYAMLGDVYWKLGLNDLALAQYKKSLSLNIEKDIVEKANKRHILDQIDLLSSGTGSEYQEEVK
jgi:tetratricopeptide (TPR) repeat protein